MKIKIQELILGLALLLAAAPAAAQVNYAVSGSTAYVTSSPNASGDIVIASTFNGYPVTSIGGSAFANCTSLTSVMIGNSVTGIGPLAFSRCTSLTGVTIGNSVSGIGNRAFENCSSLKSVTIPNSVTRIEWFAFSGCTSLTNVIIGNSVTSIEDRAFWLCTSLMNLSVAAANPAYSSLNGVLFDKAQTTLITFPLGRAGSYVIPGSVTDIGWFAFYAGTNLTGVTIGNSVTTIGGYAFDGCTSLTNVTIPNSVTIIGKAAFYNCTSLTSVIIPSSVTGIGDGAFCRCTNMTNYTFLGNAPRLLYEKPPFRFECYFSTAGATAYYYCGTTGWEPTYDGLPTVMLFAPIAPGSPGVKPGGFGFTLLPCLPNQTIVVETSANLVNWQPIWTNTLSGASADFVDPEWVNHTIRFYRARSN